LAKSVCLGCGAVLEPDADCEVCHARLARCLGVFAHWPLELAISPATLAEVERAIRHHLYVGSFSPQVSTELLNTVNIIRSYLQHIAAGFKAYKDPPAQGGANR
jgi:hypothetical protein